MILLDPVVEVFARPDRDWLSAAAGSDPAASVDIVGKPSETEERKGNFRPSGLAPTIGSTVP
ncbi:MAG: hypothetical protein AAAB35_08350 [Phyllobacterium sp.]|uniref:hypothetical protein n=1 Tax=Phyllobacterium sp. TaxID=1871046 RepID=UPI0030F0EBAE